MFVSAIALATPNTTTAGTGSDVLKRNEPLGANARAPAPARVADTRNFACPPCPFAHLLQSREFLFRNRT
jgi:hypothetical protein